LETKDCFVNVVKSMGSIAVDPGVKLEKKDLYKDLIAKCQKFRGQIGNIPLR